MKLSLERLRPVRVAVRFCTLFTLLLAVFALVFEHFENLAGTLYLYPVSLISTFLLNLAGVGADLNADTLGAGFCELNLGEVVYLVTFECVGFFALLIFFAATIAYPATYIQRAKGLLLGVPAISIFGSFRLIVLGIVAHVIPDWITVFHIYIMELVTLTFVIYVWIHWIEEVIHGG